MSVGVKAVSTAQPVEIAQPVTAARAGKGGVGATENTMVSAAAPAKKAESKQWLVVRLVSGVFNLVKAVIGGVLGGAWYVVRNVIIRNIPFVGRIVDNADKKAAAAKTTMDKLTADVKAAQAQLDEADGQLDTAADKLAGDRFYQLLAKRQDARALTRAETGVSAAEAALEAAQTALNAARAPKKVKA